jgi:hypothetical protein
MKLLSLYRCVVMSSVDEHCKTSSLNLSSHSNKESESKMLQHPDTSSSNDNEATSRTDDAAVKVLNSDPVEDSEQWSDKAANEVRTDTSPNKTMHPVNTSDEIVKSKPVEEATAVASHESADTAGGNEGNNEIVLTFPQRVRAIQR